MSEACKGETRQPFFLMTSFLSSSIKTLTGRLTAAAEATLARLVGLLLRDREEDDGEEEEIDDDEEKEGGPGGSLLDGESSLNWLGSTYIASLSYDLLVRTTD